MISQAPIHLFNATGYTQRVTTQTPDGHSPVETRATYLTGVGCLVQPVSGRESPRYGRENNRITHDVFVDGVNDIVETDFFIVNGHTFDIQFVQDYEMAGVLKSSGARKRNHRFNLMSASYKFNGDKFLKAMRAALVSAVKTSAFDVQIEMKQMLNTPGRGRVYVRNKTGSRNLRIHGGGPANAALAATAAAEAKGQTKSFRELGFHQASAPGDPPAKDTGHLGRIQVDDSGLNGDTMIRARIGTSLDYGKILEEGTRYIAPRPWARPAIANKAQGIKQRIKDAANGVAKAFGGK